MDMIDLRSKSSLIALHDRVKSVLGAQGVDTASPEVDLDRISADLLGAESWPVLMANVTKHEQDEGLLNIQASAWNCVLMGLVDQKYISQADLELLLDEAVDDMVGTSETITETINNAGPEAQVRAIAEQGTLRPLEYRLSGVTNIDTDDLRSLISAGIRYALNGHAMDQPMDIKQHLTR